MTLLLVLEVLEHVPSPAWLGHAQMLKKDGLFFSTINRNPGLG